MIHVAILFLEQSHASTAVGPLEVFRAAGVLWNTWAEEPLRPRFRVSTASAGGGPVQPEGSYTLLAEGDLADVRGADLVFVPSAGVDTEAQLARNRPVVAFLREAYARGARIAGVCSGVSLLAEAGLLDGRVATTHWALVDEYRARFPRVLWRPEELVTESDGIFCGGGVHAALDLALYLVEAFCDRALAVECAKALLIDMPRACQAGFAVLPVGTRHDDEAIRRAEEWIRGHCRESFRFEGLAGELGMSPRNFIRRFKAATGLSPVEYLQRLRVRAAKRLLEDGGASVQEVGSRVGYEDAAFFRALFKRHTGLVPATYRRRFGPDRAAGRSSPA